MTRLTQHPADDILDATRKLVLDKGVKSATVDAIAAESGAPVGSLYHRFGSRVEGQERSATRRAGYRLGEITTGYFCALDEFNHHARDGGLPSRHAMASSADDAC
jgi:AcrR family transcriptional regulator